MASSVATAPLTVDPVTFEVIRHRLLAITGEQAATLAAISGSKHVTEISDYNVGLYLADGAVAMMHMLDIGGMRPGSFCFDATEMYQEGLQLPPTRLVEGGVLRQDILNI